MGQPINLYANQQGIQIILPATQGENLAREYDFTIIGLDNQPINLSGTTVIMYVIKDQYVVQIPSTISKNVATVVLPAGACDVPGNHQCFIQVINPDVFDLRIDNMILSVIPCDIDGAGEASSEFTELTQLISNAQQAITNANEAAEEARTTAETVATQTAQNVISQQKAQPNGLATLNSEGNLVQTNGLVTSVNGQSGDITNVAEIETGTFTPTLTTLPDSSVTVTYTQQLGNYTKIGNVVVFSLYIRGNITNVSNSPSAKIAGIPFSAVAPTAVSIGTLYNCTTYIDGVSAVFQTNAYGDLIGINFGGNNKDIGSNNNVWAVGDNFIVNISGTFITTS